MTTAVERTDDVTSQPNNCTSIENSLPIEGSATDTAVANKDALKEARDVTKRRIILFILISFVILTVRIIPLYFLFLP
jgi:t-SNARE complex subunit (syntaxin)